MRHALTLIGFASSLAACSPGSFIGGGDDDDIILDDIDAGLPGTPDAVPDDGRAKPGLAGLWKLRGGTGTIIPDTSDVLPALDLTIADPLAAVWEPDGLNFVAPTIARTNAPATKINDACVLSNEITLEVWMTPASLEIPLTPPRVVTMSVDPGNADFLLAQIGPAYEFRLRNVNSDLAGTPSLVSQTAAIETQHVVITRTAAGEAAFYINGLKQPPDQLPGALSTWDPVYELAFGNELTLDRPWLGKLHLVAVYCRALSQAEVSQNLAAGY